MGGKTKRKPDRVLRNEDGDVDSYYFHPTRSGRFAVVSEGSDEVAVMFVDRSDDFAEARSAAQVSEALMCEIEEWVR